MMKILISVILLIIMVVQTYAESASASQNKDPPLVVSTCKNTPHYRLCLAVLRRSPRSAKADVWELALIAVGAVKTEAERAMDAIKKVRKGGEGKEVAAALKQCEEVYDAVLEGDVQEAEEGLKLGDPKFAENGMADAVVEADSCEGGFAGVGKSPLSRVNSAVHDIAEVARAIIRNLL
ncbi:cell wall / vacuolar inhibitor of fructosidase 1 [Sesamum indicum]|uniref:Cell wall / vacuolar inhibitor of fructosidase 1 n=1 Tax=Sesamum indicum TaxID=4182 RepID=A0A6I9SMZ9_SESIN|nr:cell wall / vacuolar inhibitor of fructosidase 1 [Sesamum indicum]